MRYNGTVYRPPLEADTFLVPVTEGCTHNDCAFCNMYQGVRFRMVPLDVVEGFLREATCEFAELAMYVTRVFLVGADPFALSADRLLEYVDLIRRYLPQVGTVSMYARTDNVSRKSDDDLRRLAETGVNDLYVGVECGMDEVLENLGKGYSAEETRRQCLRLNAAGIRHFDLLMLGCAGKGRGLQAAKATAALENEILPAGILVNTMTAFAGTRLDEDIREGRFSPASELENLSEERALLEALELPETYYWAIHPLDTVGIEGVLGRERDAMLRTLDEAIAKADASFFRPVSVRGKL